MPDGAPPAPQIPVGEAARWIPARMPGPRDVAVYVAHVRDRRGLRDLARELRCAPSSVMRTVRRVEDARDHPVVDRLISEIEAGRAPASRPKERAPRVVLGPVPYWMLSPAVDGWGAAEMAAAMELRSLAERDAEAASRRVAGLGPVLEGIALLAVVEGRDLQDCERLLGLPARSAKAVLRIAMLHMIGGSRCSD